MPIAIPEAMLADLRREFARLKWLGEDVARRRDALEAELRAIDAERYPIERAIHALEEIAKQGAEAQSR